MHLSVSQTERQNSILQKMVGSDESRSQYPFNKSNFVTYLVVPTRSTQSSIVGRGTESGFVIELTLR